MRLVDTGGRSFQAGSTASAKALTRAWERKPADWSVQSLTAAGAALQLGQFFCARGLPCVAWHPFFQEEPKCEHLPEIYFVHIGSKI